MQRAKREPLVHFLVLGTLIFAVDHVLLNLRGNPQDIVVTKEAYQEARETFVAGLKREPSAAELKTLTDRWVDNEVLYREGLALGLDRGDPAMRDRVVFKTLSLAQAGLALPKIDEAGLQRWFESRRERYDIPARFDFEEAVLGGTEATPDKLSKFAAALNARQAPDAEGSLRIFKDRPRPNLVQSYGETFAKALEKQEVGSWSVVQGKDGGRVVHLVAVRPGQAVRFDEVKERVYQEWKETTTTELTKTAIREIARKYRIRDEGKVS
ncbi:MAG: peptidyl-prolyl cis-trans isomerase [Herminiimonas sp.]|nr:peptidyl-prolyl cis-trans isomerase [Herminiimonas sp.]